MTHPAISTVEVRPRVPTRVVVLTGIECLLLVLFGAGSSLYSTLFGFVSDSCGERSCNFGLITAGIFVAFIGCLVAAVLFVILALVRLVRRRARAWLFPLIGAAVVAILFWSGYVLVIEGARLPLFGAY